MGWVGCEKMGSGVLDSNEISICCPWWGQVKQVVGTLIPSPIIAGFIQSLTPAQRGPYRGDLVG